MSLIAFVLLCNGVVRSAGAQKKQAQEKKQLSSVQVPPGEKDDAKLQAAAKVGPDQVKADAMGRHKGWPVKYVHLKNLKGNLVYEVEFTDDEEYFYDAGTGELLNGKEAKKLNRR